MDPKDLVHGLMIGLYVGSWIAAMITFLLFRRRMKTQHARAWEQLRLNTGQDNMPGSWHLMRWTFRRDYAALGDPTLTLLGDRAVRLARVFMFFFVLYFIAFFAGVWS